MHFSSCLADYNLTLVRSDKNLSIGHPAVRRVVLRDVTVLFLVHLSRLERHIHALVLLDEVLVGGVAGDKDHILVRVREADLGADWVHRRVWNLLLCHTSLLVHLPNVKRLLWL